MCGRMPRARHLRGGGPSPRVHERYRIQRDPGSPDKGLGLGGNHSEKGAVARRERAKEGVGLLIGSSLRNVPGTAATTVFYLLLVAATNPAAGGHRLPRVNSTS